MKAATSLCAAALAVGSPAWAGMEEDVARVRHEWEHVKYEVPAKQQEPEFEKLAKDSAKVMAQYPKQAEPAISVFGFQLPLWYAVMLAPSFAIYLISMVGETNRAPFDLPEAEGELVGGFHTEYSSMRFAMFFMAEYMNMITVSALAATLFLGGWHAPLPFNLIPGADSGWWGLLWFVLKVLVLLFLFVWLRGTLPRLRYDQFMRFGWRWLIPISLAWILAVAAVRVGQSEGWFSRPAFWVVSAIILGALVVLSFFGPEEKKPVPEPEEEFDAFAGGYPVPPSKGQVLPELAGVLRPGPDDDQERRHEEKLGGTT